MKAPQFVVFKNNYSLKKQLKGIFIWSIKYITKKTKHVAHKREKTISLYMEASSSVEARKIIEDNTPYNIELIQELDGNHLDYEKENADFKLVEFE